MKLSCIIRPATFLVVMYVTGYKVGHSEKYSGLDWKLSGNGNSY